MEVVRAVSRARISLSGMSVFDTIRRDDSSFGISLIRRDSITREEREVLDAVLREVERWRKFLSAGLDAWGV